MSGAATGVKSVKSAERVLDLLEHIGEMPDGATFSELSRHHNIPKSSLHALLDVLTVRGYVELRTDSRTFSLGLRVWETGQAYQRHHNVLREAKTTLEAIVARVNETAQLAKLVGSENVYLAKVDSTHPLRLQSEVGGRLSAHATGVGKALLAHLSDDEVIRRFGEGDLQAYTGNTITSTDGLLDELAVIRNRGFAIDNEEYTPGVFCIAVPVFDTNGASTAVSVSVPTMRVTSAGLAKIIAVVSDASLRLSGRCGVREPNPLLLRLAQSDLASAALQNVIESGRYRLPPMDGSTPGGAG